MAEEKKKKVSGDAAKLLDHISGITAEKMEEESKKAEAKAKALGFSYRRCVWWGGCYYCNDGYGWYLVYCVA